MAPGAVRPRRRGRSGFTLVEVLVTGLLAFVVVGLCFTSMVAHKNLVGRDTVRTRMVQNVRGALDVIGADVRVMGQSLPAIAPGLVLTDSPDGDTLRVRRNPLGETDVLTLCAPLAGSMTRLRVADASLSPTGFPTCVPGPSRRAIVDRFEEYRNRGVEGAVVGGLLSLAGRTLQLFEYRGFEDTGAGLDLLVSPVGTCSGCTLATGAGVVVLVNQFTYRLDPATRDLTVTEIGNPLVAPSPEVVAFDVTEFDVRVTDSSGAVRTTFDYTADPTASWQAVRGVAVAVRSDATFGGKPVTRRATALFFPRNALSL